MSANSIGTRTCIGMEYRVFLPLALIASPLWHSGTVPQIMRNTSTSRLLLQIIITASEFHADLSSSQSLLSSCNKSNNRSHV